MWDPNTGMHVGGNDFGLGILDPISGKTGRRGS